MHRVPCSTITVSRTAWATLPPESAKSSSPSRAPWETFQLLRASHLTAVFSRRLPLLEHDLERLYTPTPDSLDANLGFDLIANTAGSFDEKDRQEVASRPTWTSCTRRSLRTPNRRYHLPNIHATPPRNALLCRLLFSPTPVPCTPMNCSRFDNRPYLAHMSQTISSALHVAINTCAERVRKLCGSFGISTH